MTKEEEAIRYIEIIKPYAGKNLKKAFDTAIKALKQEPCKDAVSREAVDKLSESLVFTTKNKADFLCNFWEGLRKLPPVTPQPKLEGEVEIYFTIRKHKEYENDDYYRGAQEEY